MTGFSPPLLLAGPVLRKVTPTSASVWVATSQACDVSLDVYGSAAFLKRDADAQMGTVAANLVGGKTRATVKVGDLLHIAVVTAPITGVAPDAVCSYNIRLAVQASGGSASGQWDLGGLKLLDLGDPSDDYQGGLGFAEGRLPGFRTPPADVESLRLYHGSCFKLHGDGPSIMANLDDPTGTGTTPRLTFNYHVDLAGGRLVVLDTRTHREYATPNGPPGLLTENALDAQLPITLTDDVPLLIVVSPAPVLGPRLIEEMINPITTRSWDLWHLAMRNQTEAAAAGYDVREPIGDLWFDVEFWNARPAAFERFLARVTRCPQVVILAGDVHYAASFAMDYQRFTIAPSDGGAVSPDPPPALSTSRVIHFTSSAFRNAWLPWVAAFARSISVAENLEQAGFEGFNLGWTHITPPVLSGGDTAPGEARVLRARLQREPVILPTEGWKNPHSTRPPEWMYQVAPLFDTRTDDLRFADLATAGFTDTLGPAVPDVPPPPADGVTGDSLVGPGGPYEIATALHAANVEGAVVTRTLVFANNVGVVTFSRVDATSPLVVQMEIYFVRPHPVSEDEKPHPYVLHSASLAPNPLTAPKQFGGPPATSQVTQS